MQEFTDRVKILDSAPQRVQLQDRAIQVLLPRGPSEGRGLPEVYDQVPFLAGPGARARGVCGMDEKSFQESRSATHQSKCFLFQA